MTVKKADRLILSLFRLLSHHTSHPSSPQQRIILSSSLSLSLLPHNTSLIPSTHLLSLGSPHLTHPLTTPHPQCAPVRGVPTPPPTPVGLRGRTRSTHRSRGTRMGGGGVDSFCSVFVLFALSVLMFSNNGGERKGWSGASLVYH